MFLRLKEVLINLDKVQAITPGPTIGSTAFHYGDKEKPMFINEGYTDVSQKVIRLQETIPSMLNVLIQAMADNNGEEGTPG